MIMKRTAVLVAFLASWAALAQQQPSVSIRCRVIDDITGEPVARVRISDSGYLDRFANQASTSNVGAEAAISVGLGLIKIPLR